MKFRFEFRKGKPVSLNLLPIARVMGTLQLANIGRRLSKGLGLQDSKMPGYSKATKAYRQKRGRQTGHRDLLMTGRMRGDMHISEVTQQGTIAWATISFATSHSRMIAARHQHVSPWFGISRQDKASLVSALQKRLRK